VIEHYVCDDCYVGTDKPSRASEHDSDDEMAAETEKDDKTTVSAKTAIDKKNRDGRKLQNRGNPQQIDKPQKPGL